MNDEKASTRKSGQMDLSDKVLYATLLALSYPLCLTAAVFTRLSHIFGEEAIRNSESIFTEAKSAAHAAVGYAFHA